MSVWHDLIWGIICCRQLESKHDAAAAYVDAALCFKKINPLGLNHPHIWMFMCYDTYDICYYSLGTKVQTIVLVWIVYYLILDSQWAPILIGIIHRWLRCKNDPRHKVNACD